MKSKPDWAEDFVRRVIHADRYRPIREAEFADLVAELRARVGASPDDSESVTEEWLRSVGFEPKYSDGLYWFSRRVPLVMWDRRENEIMVGNSATGWHRVADKATRGHVRRLCQALGIALPAAPADDGEPITEEWLRSVGFVGDKTDPYALHIESRFQIGEDTAVQTLTCEDIDNASDGCCWTVHCRAIELEPESCLLARPITTRQHVRELCSALGIALPAAPEGGD